MDLAISGRDKPLTLTAQRGREHSFTHSLVLMLGILCRGVPGRRALAWIKALHRTWRQRSTERRYLLTSDYRLRVDLVATGQDIAAEAAKPFWQK